MSLVLNTRIFRWSTVGSKIIRALATILVIFFWYDRQFCHYHACYKQYKVWSLWFDKYLFHKTALDLNFLTRIIASARTNFATDFTVACMGIYEMPWFRILKGEDVTQSFVCFFFFLPPPLCLLCLLFNTFNTYAS